MAAPVEAKNPFLNQDVDRHFVKQALDLMTSQEVVSLMNWKEVLSAPKSYPWLVYSHLQFFLCVSMFASSRNFIEKEGKRAAVVCKQ